MTPAFGFCFTRPSLQKRRIPLRGTRHSSASKSEQEVLWLQHRSWCRNRFLGAHCVKSLDGIVVATYSVAEQIEEDDPIELISASPCIDAKLFAIRSSSWALGSCHSCSSFSSIFETCPSVFCNPTVSHYFLLPLDLLPLPLSDENIVMHRTTTKRGNNHLSILPRYHPFFLLLPLTSFYSPVSPFFSFSVYCVLPS